MSALWPSICFQMAEQIFSVSFGRVRELRTEEVVERIARKLT